MQLRTLLKCVIFTLISTGVCTVSSDTLIIRDGEKITPLPPSQPEGFLYWGTADTTIDAAFPDADFGGADILRLAPRKSAVLIQFEQLLPCLGGPFVDIEAATVTLHLKNPPQHLPPASAVRVFRLRRRWNEGGKEGVTNYWSTTYNARFYSADPDKNIAWVAAGARSKADLIAVKSAKAEFNSENSTLVISGLEGEIRHFLDRHYENHGWYISIDAAPRMPELTFYSRETAHVELRPALSLNYTPTEPVRYPVDLGIAYIARYPEYYAWLDMGSYSNKKFRGVDVGVLKDPAFADVPKNPDAGDMLQYTATIANHGSKPVDGFAYRWRINGETVHSGKYTRTVPPHSRKRIFFSYPCPPNWSDHRDEFLTLRVEPLTAVKENKNNNELTIYTKARAAGIHCDETSKDFYRTHYNAYGTYNFDDWIQFQIVYWNQIYFPKSRIKDVFPDGALPRVRVQRISYFYDGDLQGAVHIAWDDRDPRYDGMWGWDFAHAKPEDMQKEDWFFRRTLRMCEPSLIHEMSHQCFGLIDIYWMTMEPAKDKTTGEGGKVALRSPRLTNEYLTGIGYWPLAGGLMGGGDTRYTPAHEPTTLYSAHSVHALNANAPYRGGFFGDYVYDMPTNVSITILAPDGSPVHNAPLKAWQSTYFEGDKKPIDDTKRAFTGTTDATGTFTLPNQPTGEGESFTTHTQHTLRPNPFGRIHVCGFNGNLLFQLEYDNTYYYYMLKSWELNMAYAHGHTNNWNFTWQLGPDYHIDTFKVVTK